MPTRTHYQSLAALFVSMAFGSCFSPTHFSMVAPGDTLKYLVTDQPPDGWSAVGFDDSKWPETTVAGIGPLIANATGEMPRVLLRRQFDVGPEYDLYQSLTLTIGGGASYMAYVNGQPMSIKSSAAAKLSLSTGMLKPSGNLLAVEAYPKAGTKTLPITVKLDGAMETAQALPGAQVVKGPFLVQPTPNGVTIVWETDISAPSQAVVDGHAYDGGAGQHHEAHVTDLQPSRSYPYHVETGDYKSEESSLTTAAKAGERVRFVVYGDNRTDGDSHRRVVEDIEGEGPDFLLNTGDLVDSSTTGEWQSFFDIEYKLLLHTPIYPALGNHEANSGGGPRYAQLFPLGRKDVYSGAMYGADFGDVHIAVVDSNGDLGAQSSWLDSDLTAAEARGAKHLFIAMHWGAFSGGTSFQHGTNDDARKHIVPVARKHHVDALFAGHDHFYERGDSNGLPYFVTGGGGAPLENSGRISETLVARSTHHYVVVDVAGPQVHYSAKDLTGATFDQLETSITR